ncbi:MAG: hypothetical protein FJW27_03880 [Acidimicrobiia bacterium]|nr:hypothetical protein [Acidimicrobiia bacterium]
MTSKTERAAVRAAVFVWLCATAATTSSAQTPPGVEHRVLATNKTSTMEKELNEVAEAGFRFRAVMGGETAIGGNEVVAVLAKSGTSRSRFAYKLLATNRTSTMEKELQAAAQEGYEYVGQTVFESMFGGDEVVCILERDKDSSGPPSQYRLLATSKTSTLERELRGVEKAGYEVMGMTVGKTALGGRELVAITRRASAPSRP